MATRLEILNPFYFPPFSKIIFKGYELFANGSIWEHLWFSLTNFAIGLTVSVVLGVLLGVPMGWYKNVSQTFDPLLSDLRHAADRAAAVDHHAFRSRLDLENYYDGPRRRVPDP